MEGTDQSTARVWIDQRLVDPGEKELPEIFWTWIIAQLDPQRRDPSLELVSDILRQSQQAIDRFTAVAPFLDSLLVPHFAVSAQPKLDPVGGTASDFDLVSHGLMVEQWLHSPKSPFRFQLQGALGDGRGWALLFSMEARKEVQVAFRRASNHLLPNVYEPDFQKKFAELSFLPHELKEAVLFTLDTDGSAEGNRSKNKVEQWIEDYQKDLYFGFLDTGLQVLTGLMDATAERTGHRVTLRYSATGPWGPCVLIQTNDDSLAHIKGSKNRWKRFGMDHRCDALASRYFNREPFSIVDTQEMVERATGVQGELREIADTLGKRLDLDPQLKRLLGEGLEAAHQYPDPSQRVHGYFSLLTALAGGYAQLTAQLKSGTGHVASKLSESHPDLEEVKELESLSVLPEPIASKFLTAIPFVHHRQKPLNYLTPKSKDTILVSEGLKRILEQDWKLQTMPETDRRELLGDEHSSIAGPIYYAHQPGKDPRRERLIVYPTVVEGENGSSLVFKFPFELIEGELPEARKQGWKASFAHFKLQQALPKFIFIDGNGPDLRSTVEQGAALLHHCLDLGPDQLIKPRQWEQQLIHTQPGAILGTKNSQRLDPSTVLHIKRTIEKSINPRIIEGISNIDLFYRLVFSTSATFLDLCVKGVQLKDLPEKYRDTISQESINDLIKISASAFLHSYVSEDLALVPSPTVFEGLPMVDLLRFKPLSLMENKLIRGSKLILFFHNPPGDSRATTPMDLWRKQATISNPSLVLEGAMDQEMGEDFAQLGICKILHHLHFASPW